MGMIDSIRSRATETAIQSISVVSRNTLGYATRLLERARSRMQFSGSSRCLVRCDSKIFHEAGTVSGQWLQG